MLLLMYEHLRQPVPVPRTTTRALRLTVSLLAATLLLSACAAPGMNTYQMRTESSVTLPAKPGDEAAPAEVKVQPITAELIIAQERAATPRPPAELPKPVASDYKIGPGDILTIIVWGHPELTIPTGEFRNAEQAGTVVAEDGTIFYPFVGIVPVAGKTTREVRNLLTQPLSKFIELVQLDVRVAAYRSKRVYVVGEVVKPGLREITDIPMTLIEAINRSDGFTGQADPANITLTRQGQTFRVDLQALYENGAVDQNIPLEPGDIVNVPDRQLNKVFVLGEVQNPGSFIMNKRRKTLAEAIGDAGDVLHTTANPQQIFVMRGQIDQPEIYHLDSRSPDALLLADRFPLQPRDIVYVDTADVVRWNRVITNILPTATLLNTTGTTFPLFRAPVR
ncbi:MAG TPA: polysaccharide biosynthesis/export family protein [Candidatus Competibacteraceae bacterium]|nr:polysaccharide biosynthesis/export family protein [Candidatus Competibacteraceae bacterium]